MKNFEIMPTGTNKNEEETQSVNPQKKTPTEITEEKKKKDITVTTNENNAPEEKESLIDSIGKEEIRRQFSELMEKMNQELNQLHDILFDKAEQKQDNLSTVEVLETIKGIKGFDVFMPYIHETLANTIVKNEIYKKTQNEFAEDCLNIEVFVLAIHAEAMNIATKPIFSKVKQARENLQEKDMNET